MSYYAFSLLPAMLLRTQKVHKTTEMPYYCIYYKGTFLLTKGKRKPPPALRPDQGYRPLDERKGNFPPPLWPSYTKYIALLKKETSPSTLLSA